MYVVHLQAMNTAELRTALRNAGLSQYQAEAYVALLQLGAASATELADALAQRYDEAAAAYGFLVRGHGIYAWGADLASARRHLEGWEFLLACEMQRRQLENDR